VEINEGDVLAIGKKQRWRFTIRDKCHRRTKSWSLVKYPLWDGTKGLDDDEVHMPVGDGSTWLIFPSYKKSEEVDYVRFADADAPHKERVYWNADEWREAPTEVMGAIMACILNGVDDFFARD
jgi:hypothetical protein